MYIINYSLGNCFCLKFDNNQVRCMCNDLCCTPLIVKEKCVKVYLRLMKTLVKSQSYVRLGNFTDNNTLSRMLYLVYALKAHFKWAFDVPNTS